MKCVFCGKGTMKAIKSSITVDIPNAISVKVDGVSKSVCNNCDEETMDLASAGEQRQKVLAALIKFYEGKQVPGPVAHYIRLEMGMSVEALGKEIGKSHSALSRSNMRDTLLDGYASEQLLALTTDFINGNHAAIERLGISRRFSSLLSEVIRKGATVVTGTGPGHRTTKVSKAS